MVGTLNASFYAAVSLVGPGGVFLQEGGVGEHPIEGRAHVAAGELIEQMLALDRHAVPATVFRRSQACTSGNA